MRRIERANTRDYDGVASERGPLIFARGAEGIVAVEMNGHSGEGAFVRIWPGDTWMHEHARHSCHKLERQEQLGISKRASMHSCYMNTSMLPACSTITPVERCRRHNAVALNDMVPVYRRHSATCWASVWYKALMHLPLGLTCAHLGALPDPGEKFHPLHVLVLCLVEALIQTCEPQLLTHPA